MTSFFVAMLVFLRLFIVDVDSQSLAPTAEPTMEPTPATTSTGMSYIWFVHLSITFPVSEEYAVAVANITTNILVLAAFNTPGVYSQCIDVYPFHSSNITIVDSSSFEYEFIIPICDEANADLVVDEYNNITIPLLTSINEALQVQLQVPLSASDIKLQTDDVRKPFEAEADEPSVAPTTMMTTQMQIQGYTANIRIDTLIFVFRLGKLSSALMMAACKLKIHLNEFEVCPLPSPIKTLETLLSLLSTSVHFFVDLQKSKR